jgi:hypothetical protein
VVLEGGSLSPLTRWLALDTSPLCVRGHALRGGEHQVSRWPLCIPVAYRLRYFSPASTAVRNKPRVGDRIAQTAPRGQHRSSTWHSKGPSRCLPREGTGPEYLFHPSVRPPTATVAFCGPVKAPYPPHLHHQRRPLRYGLQRAR